MSGLVDKITGFFGGGLIDSISNVADKFIETPDEKSAFKISIETLMQKRQSEVEQTVRAELAAKQSIIVAELNQGDNYTKRARPTLIYFGMVVIAFNYCVVPVFQLFMSVGVNPFLLPTEFWIAWGGAVSVYSIGRSAEKRGIQNKITQSALGSKKINLFD